MTENKEELAVEVLSDQGRERLKSALPKLLEYAKSDKTLSQIRSIFGVHLGRPLDGNTFEDLRESLRMIIDPSTAAFLTDLVANIKLNYLKQVEEQINESKTSDFIRELAASYGILARRARNIRYYPNEWQFAHTEVFGDLRRGFMMKTEITLGNGRKITIVSTPDTTILLAQHLIRNVLINADSNLEDSEGKQKNFLQFISPQTFKLLEEQFEILKTRLATNLP
jgi:hypothetical protein